MTEIKINYNILMRSYLLFSPFMFKHDIFYKYKSFIFYIKMKTFLNVENKNNKYKVLNYKAEKQKITSKIVGCKQ